MELWIRSQDKKRLLKIDDIGLADYNGYYYVVGYKNGKEIKLGEYGFHISTRALEVLDEIQKILKPQVILSKLGKPIAETCDGFVYREPDEYEIKELSAYIYEMPKE